VGNQAVSPKPTLKGSKTWQTTLAGPAQTPKGVRIEETKAQRSHYWVKQLNGQANHSAQATNIAKLLKKEEIF
jgi:hypothetical protein